jgi:Helicase conserved C-terminal domain
MSTESRIAALRSIGLQPHQAQVVVEFLQRKAPITGLLIASVGTGKSTMAATLVREFIAAHPQGRCGVVTAPALVTQMERVLGSRLDQLGVPVLAVSARSYRALLGTSDATDDSIWPQPVVALWTFDALAASDQVQSAWATFAPDLLIVDEGHRLLEDRVDLLRSKVATVPAVLVMSAVADPRFEATLANGRPFARWDWVAPLFDWNGDSLWSSPHVVRKVVEFRRTESEREVLSSVRRLYGNPNSTNLAGRSVFAAADSSLFALESVLLRRRNRLAHALAPDDDSDAAPAELDALPTESWGAVRIGEELAGIRSVLDRLASLGSDSKVEVFADQVRSLRQGASKPIAAFVQFVRTQDLLAQTLQDDGITVSVVNGSMSFDARESASRAESDVLLVTDAALQGHDLRHVECAIHFDIPRGGLQLALRESRLGPVAGENRARTVVALRDRDAPEQERVLREAGFQDIDATNTSGK